MFSTTGLFSMHGRSPGVSTRLLWAYRGQPEIREGWGEPFEAASAAFFVEAGLVEIEIGKQLITLAPGDFFLGASGVRRQRMGSETRLLSIGYEALWQNGRPIYDKGLNRAVPAAKLGKHGRALHEAGVILVKDLFPGKRRVGFLDTARQPAPEADSFIDRQIAFWTWFGTLQSMFKALDVHPMLPLATTSLVQRVQGHLDERPLDAPFSSVEAELSLPVGWRRVQQMFQDELHVSPQHYFELRRLAAARGSLLDPEKTVKAVAAELGFRSLSHFSDWFKRGTGLSPRQFRPES
jgi:Helix-turn-helix domain